MITYRAKSSEKLVSLKYLIGYPNFFFYSDPVYIYRESSEAEG